MLHIRANPDINTIVFSRQNQNNPYIAGGYVTRDETALTSAVPVNNIAVWSSAANRSITILTLQAPPPIAPR